MSRVFYVVELRADAISLHRLSAPFAVAAADYAQCYGFAHVGPDRDEAYAIALMLSLEHAKPVLDSLPREPA